MHNDGTEVIISGARPPDSGDTCMGSWEQTGPCRCAYRHADGRARSAAVGGTFSASSSKRKRWHGITSRAYPAE